MSSSLKMIRCTSFCIALLCAFQMGFVAEPAFGAEQALVGEAEQTRGFLGVKIGDITPEIANRLGLAKPLGVWVAEVVINSPGAAAGIKSEDVIVEFDGREIKSSHELTSLIASSPGKSVVLKVLRDKKEVAVSVTIGAMKVKVRVVPPELDIAFKAVREKDYATALKYLKPLADAGDPGAQNLLGVLYNHGLGVPKDEAEAVKWYRRAAEQGEAAAQLNLAWAYLIGQGVMIDEVEAVGWFRKAAGQGDAAAQTHLAGMYAKGQGVARDDAQAVKWWRRAAEQGNANGETNLGWAYEYGRGVPKDEVEAVKWYRKAAAQGNEHARTGLERLKHVVSRVEAEEKRQRLARAGEQGEQVGNLREAVKEYVAALQSAPEGSSTDQQLREKIINLVQKLDPPPAIPEEARRYAVFGQTAIREAKSDSEYKRAVEQFQKALRLAPWWADAYINLAIVQEKIGAFEAAARSLKLYLLASPKAPDANTVQAKIYELEYKQITRAAAERLKGIWARERSNDPNWQACIKAQGNSFEIYDWGGSCEGGKVIYKGTLDGLRIVGTAVVPGSFFLVPICKLPGEVPMAGEITPDWSRITLRYEFQTGVYHPGLFSSVDCKSGNHSEVMNLYRKER